MKMATMKKCDRCFKEGQCKRMCFQIHFPNYNYVGFDLCSECENKLNILLDTFLEQNNNGN